MSLFIKMILFVHIFFGFMALFFGLFAIISKKGSKVHRLTGKIFFVSMLCVALTAVLISLVKNIYFLLMISLFSFYQNYMGYRSVRNKTLRPSLLDWSVLLMAVINGIFMVVFWNVVSVTFGIISILLTVRQIRIYFRLIRGKEIPKLLWLRQHIAMMTGAYIATLTAFLVVNVKNFTPQWLPWLAPAGVLIPFIIYWSRKFTKSSMGSMTQ